MMYFCKYYIFATLIFTTPFYSLSFIHSFGKFICSFFVPFKPFDIFTLVCKCSYLEWVTSHTLLRLQLPLINFKQHFNCFITNTSAAFTCYESMRHWFLLLNGQFDSRLSCYISNDSATAFMTYKLTDISTAFSALSLQLFSARM